MASSNDGNDGNTCVIDEEIQTDISSEDMDTCMFDDSQTTSKFYVQVVHVESLYIVVIAPAKQCSS